MRNALLTLLCLLAPCALLGQTKTVTKTVGANALTESFVVPSGASITIQAGASIINQGTATGFDVGGAVSWSSITGKPTTLAGYGILDGLTAAAAASAYQPIDADLTSIAGLTTTAFGRGLLTQADAAAARTTLGLGTLATQSGNLSDYLTTAAAATAYQPLDADLTSIAALSTTSFGRGFLTQADAAAARTTLGLGTLATQSGTLTDYLTISSAASTYASLSGSYSNPSWITSLAWSKITGAPTFLTPTGDGSGLTSLDPYALQQRSASDGQVLAWSTANSRWQPTTAGGSGTVTSVGLTGGNGITVTGTSPITSSGSWTLGVNATDLKSHLSLSNVENVAVSTWVPTTTTLGGVKRNVRADTDEFVTGIGTDGSLQYAEIPGVVGVLGVSVSGAGSAVSTGIKGDVYVPYDCVIEKAVLLADQTGSIVIDVWADTPANFPPTDADSITAAAPPTLTSAVLSENSTLTGWSKTLTAGTILRFNVDSASTLTRVTLNLIVRKTSP